MGIPERRYVQYEDDGAVLYQCLACKGHLLSISSAEYMSFCPYCGVKWTGNIWSHRPHSVPRWEWDLCKRESYSLRSLLLAEYTEANKKLSAAADEKAIQLKEHRDRAFKNYKHWVDWEQSCRYRREKYERGVRARKYDWDDYCPTPERDAAGWAWHVCSKVTPPAPYPRVAPPWPGDYVIRFADGREELGVYSEHGRPQWVRYGSDWKFTQQPTHWYGRLNVCQA